MIGLLNALTKVNKEGKIISEYMKSIKTIIDDLAMIDHSFSDGEIVVYTLNGPTSDFKELSAAIRAHDSDKSFEELHDKILDHEIFFNQENAKQGIPFIIAKQTKKAIIKETIVALSLVLLISLLYNFI